MEQSYYWNIHQEYHPKNRLLKYSKSSKISKETLQILSRIRKIYHKLPPIIYSVQDQQENEGINFQKYKKTIYSILFLFLFISFKRYYS
jgi:hypothetical protein